MAKHISNIASQKSIGINVGNLSKQESSTSSMEGTTASTCIFQFLGKLMPLNFDSELGISLRDVPHAVFQISIYVTCSRYHTRCVREELGTRVTVIKQCLAAGLILLEM